MHLVTQEDVENVLLNFEEPAVFLSARRVFEATLFENVLGDQLKTSHFGAPTF